MKKFAKANEGMTLVELLVSIAVLSILLGGVFSMMRAASLYHSNSNREVEIQNQLQNAFTQVSNYIVDADVDMGFDKPKKTLYVCHKDYFYRIAQVEKRLYIEQLEYGSNEHNLSGAQAVSQATALPDASNTKNLLSDRVESFVVDTSNQAKGFVVLAMKLTYDSRSASLSQNVFLRNTANIVMKPLTGFVQNVEKKEDGAFYVDISDYQGEYLHEIKISTEDTNVHTRVKLSLANEAAEMKQLGDMELNKDAWKSTEDIRLDCNYLVITYSDPAMATSNPPIRIEILTSNWKPSDVIN